MGDGRAITSCSWHRERQRLCLDANDATAGPRHDGVLWQDSFIDPAHGVTLSLPRRRGRRYPAGARHHRTPVIERATQTLYVVTKVKVQALGEGGRTT